MDKTPDKSLVWTFPTPNTPLLAVAYRDLYLAAEGTAQQKDVLRQGSCRISGFESDHTVGVWLTRE